MPQSSHIPYTSDALWGFDVLKGLFFRLVESSPRLFCWLVFCICSKCYNQLKGRYAYNMNHTTLSYLNVSRSLSSTTNDKDLEKLCKGILSSFEECLSQDFFLLSDTAPDKILTLLRPDVYSSINQEQPGAVECIPHDLMLKICALAILTSHTLRSLGEYLSYHWSLSMVVVTSCTSHVCITVRIFA